MKDTLQTQAEAKREEEMGGWVVAQGSGGCRVRMVVMVCR
jgi:hypothetical protein